MLPLWVPRDHFKFHDVVLSILGYHRDVRVIGQYVHIRSLHSSAEKTQQESPKDMILKMRECHNNPTVNGV